MPCMKLTSASAGARCGGRAVDGERTLPAWPGAPGWTIGACWPHAVVAVTVVAATVVAATRTNVAEIGRMRSAMCNYTTWGFTGSIGLAGDSAFHHGPLPHYGS